MGAFPLLSADYRIGAADPAHKYTANGVAIGLTMPRPAVAICRSALNELDADAHAATKRRTRAEDLAQLRKAIEADAAELLATTAVLR